MPLGGAPRATGTPEITGSENASIFIGALAGGLNIRGKPAADNIHAIIAVSKSQPNVFSSAALPLNGLGDALARLSVNVLGLPFLSQAPLGYFNYRFF